MFSPAIRYVVSFTPIMDVEEVCLKSGMKPNDGTSFWDWIEPDHCEQDVEFHTFRLALAFAKQKVDEDVFGTPRLIRQHMLNDTDDLGTTYDSKSWGTDATWEIDDEREFAEDEPDLKTEAAR